MNGNGRTLLIFIKNPVAGRVKTRLAAEVGDEEALRIYHALLAHTQRLTLATTARRLLFYSDQIDESDSWPSALYEKHLQQGDDLGERMRRAFELAFDEGAEQVVIIGSDCPGLEPPLLEEAFYQLQRHDFVIGPATDGGYYLLGMRRYQPSVFDDINWSSAGVLDDTLDRIAVLKADHYLLPPLSDVDYLVDWEPYAYLLQ